MPGVETGLAANKLCSDRPIGRVSGFKLRKVRVRVPLRAQMVQCTIPHAPVVKLVDALVLGTSLRVGVRVPPGALDEPTELGYLCL